MRKIGLAICLLAIFAVGQPAFGGDAMNRDETALEVRKKWHGEGEDALAKTDPELSGIAGRLLYGEILANGSLDDRQRAAVIIAALVAGQAWEELGDMVAAAMNVGFSPIEIRETIYQCAPYVGFPRVAKATRLANERFAARNVVLPLESAATVTEATRFEKGLKTQKDIFGAVIDKMHENASGSQRPLLVNYLSAWCFGDFYTRGILDLKMRELITFSAIVALGGCDPQAQAHAAANLKVGNSADNLVDTLAAMLPFIGYPRTLNGLASVNAALQQQGK